MCVTITPQLKTRENLNKSNSMCYIASYSPVVVFGNSLRSQRPRCSVRLWQAALALNAYRCTSHHLV